MVEGHGEGPLLADDGPLRRGVARQRHHGHEGQRALRDRAPAAAVARLVRQLEAQHAAADVLDVCVLAVQLQLVLHAQTGCQPDALSRRRIGASCAALGRRALVGYTADQRGRGAERIVCGLAAAGSCLWHRRQQMSWDWRAGGLATCSGDSSHLPAHGLIWHRPRPGGARPASQARPGDGQWSTSMQQATTL